MSEVSGVCLLPRRAIPVQSVADRQKSAGSVPATEQPAQHTTRTRATCLPRYPTKVCGEREAQAGLAFGRWKASARSTPPSTPFEGGAPCRKRSIERLGWVHSFRILAAIAVNRPDSEAFERHYKPQDQNPHVTTSQSNRALRLYNLYMMTRSEHLRRDSPLPLSSLRSPRSRSTRLANAPSSSGPQHEQPHKKRQEIGATTMASTKRINADAVRSTRSSAEALQKWPVCCWFFRPAQGHARATTTALALLLKLSGARSSERHLLKSAERGATTRPAREAFAQRGRAAGS